MTDSITRGGQTTMHGFRMRIQVFKIAFKIGFVFAVVYYIYALFTLFTIKQLYWILEWYRANIWFELKGKDSILKTWGAGRRYAVDIINNQKIVYWKQLLFDTLISNIWISIFILLTIAVVVVLYFAYRGSSLTKKRYVSGSQIVSKRTLIRQIKTYNKKAIGIFNRFNPFFFDKTYRIAGIPYPHMSESTHTLIVGATGTGKTVAIKDLVKQIRGNGDRAIIFDRMRTFTGSFYEAKSDILLNPLDNRCPKWNLFQEARDETDFEAMAKALIPVNPSSPDQFWHHAARNLFMATCKSMWEAGDFDNNKLCYNLLNADMTTVEKIVKETAAQNLVNENSPKMTLSVQAVLSIYAKSLELLPNVGKDFSIRRWIEQEDISSFLFLPSSGNQHEALRPLISMLLEIAINSMLSLEQNKNRKIWFILDEVASLHNIPSLPTGLTESRQFGGCFVLGLQAFSALKSTYGINTAGTILTNTRTHMCLAQSSFEEAEFVAKNFGFIEEASTKESLSFGANTIRDGNNLQTESREKRLITATDIQNLKNLEGYVRFPQGFSVAKITLKFKDMGKKAEKFVPRPKTKANIFKNKNRQFPKGSEKEQDFQSPPAPTSLEVRNSVFSKGMGSPTNQSHVDAQGTWQQQQKPKAPVKNTNKNRNKGGGYMVSNKNRFIKKKGKDK